MAKRRSKGKILKEELKIEQLQKKELEKLESLKQEINKDVGSHPLTKITRSDIIRSSIGALIGTVGHFAFFYGIELAERISNARALSLYFLALLVAFGFMYYSGFRKVKNIRIFRFIPLRVMVIYLVSLVVVVLTLFIFGIIDFQTPFIQVFKAISTNLLLAVLGASTADILGKDE